MSTKNHDTWDAELYDSKHGFVSKYGKDIIRLLEPQRNEVMLDLGCGTGDLTKVLHDLGVDVTGIDQSENMIEQAKTKYTAIPFQIADATALPYRKMFDAVFSNATLHWIKTPKKALQSIYDSLQKDGRFVAEFGAKGNVQQITNVVRDQFHHLGLPYPLERFPWYFPSVGEYTRLMETVGFHVTFAQQFARPTPLDGPNGLRHWLEMFGKTMFSGINQHTVNKIITNVETELRDRNMFQDDHWIADYQRIRVVGWK